MPVEVSVIIPTRERPVMLAEAVYSVLSQIRRPREIVVVNDGAPLRAAPPLDHPLVRVVENRLEGGAPGARNTGLELATAPWVSFMDDDDLWDSAFLDTMARVAEAAEDDVIAVFSGYRTSRSNAPDEETLPAAPGPNLDDLIVANSVGACSFVLCRTAAVRQVGAFDPDLPGAQDWDLWLRLAEAGRFHPVEVVLGTYRVHHEGQISSDSPTERFRRYRPFFSKRWQHRLAPAHNQQLADEVYWWGVLMAWTGDVEGACSAFDLCLEHAPRHRKASIMRIVARSPFRRPLLRLVYSRRRRLMRMEDRKEQLPDG